MRGRLRLSPVFVFLLCLLIYCGWGREVGLFLLAAFLHECAHLLALLLCGCQMWRISVGFGGAVIETGAMSYTQELLCAAAGPLANLLLTAIPDPTFRALNVTLFSYNILPLGLLDGQRMLAAALGLLVPRLRRKICDIASVSAAALLLLVGLFCTARLPYGRLPIMFAAAILLRACFFQTEGLDKAHFVG